MNNTTEPRRGRVGLAGFPGLLIEASLMSPAVPASAGPGCEHCKHTGYGGRLPIAELLTPSDALRDAIVRGATAHEIRASMRAARRVGAHRRRRASRAGHRRLDDARDRAMCARRGDDVIGRAAGRNTRAEFPGCMPTPRLTRLNR